MRRLVRVYCGYGSTERSLTMLMDALKRHLSPDRYSVQTISPQQILQNDWQENTALLAIGGGFDRGFISALGRQGIAIIRLFVHGGGAYLGLCAGGYFGCEQVVFDKGGPLEVCGERDLKFYPGACIGPAFPGFKYNSELGAHAVRLNWIGPPLQPVANSVTYNFAHTHDDSAHPSQSKHQITCYFNGGGYFAEPKEDLKHKYHILAVYRDLDGSPPAIVYCRSGRGRVVLTGVHLEYDTEQLDQQDSCIQAIIGDLRCSHKDRERIFTETLKILGLDTVTPSKL